MTPSVPTYFVEGEAKQSVISYAKWRPGPRHGEIRVYNAAVELAQAITFDERSASQRTGSADAVYV